MGITWPTYPTDVQGGDEPTHSPTKNQNSLLGAERGTQLTRRLETDSDRNLYVHVAEDDTTVPSSVSILAVGSATNVPDSTLTTIVTYTAIAESKLTRIAVSGTMYGKFQLFKNTTLFETRRTSPERSTDFMFSSPLRLAPGDILDVKVTQFQTGLLGDFESTIYGA